MVRQGFISLILLALTSSCKAQDKRHYNITKVKDKERTTERFDAKKYFRKRQGSVWLFENNTQGMVRQFGGDNGSEFVEYARKGNELYGTYKEYYNKTRTLKTTGQYYYNKFSIGIWKLYKEDGYLIETIDKDIPYKNYPWEKVERFIKEDLKLNLFDKDVEVNRYVDKETNIPIWYISWRTDNTKVFSMKINALTGKAISKETNEVRE